MCCVSAVCQLPGRMASVCVCVCVWSDIVDSWLRDGDAGGVGWAD